jgi:hypothetical protein
MSKLGEKDKFRISNLAEDFRVKTLNNASPKEMCFTISYPLSLHLINNGIENSMTCGKFIDGRSHYWLTLIDEEKTIIDPTITQFDVYKDKSEVFIGKKPEEFTVTTGEWFNESYKKWSTPLLNDGLIYPSLPDKNLSPKIDLKLYVGVNLRAAIILNEEIEQMED